MIALDTNLLARYLLNDDKPQTTAPSRAQRILRTTLPRDPAVPADHRGQSIGRLRHR
jgi:hypothetical protein